MNRFVLRMIASVFALGCVGCDLSQMSKDINAALSAFEQDKMLAEGFVADLKRSFTPDKQEFQQAQALYFKAREANDKVLGKINMAVSTGDRSVTPDDTIVAARSAMSDFITASRDSLAPNQRGLPIAAALAAVPAIHSIIANFHGKREEAVAKQFVTRVRLKEWDSIRPSSDEETPKGRRGTHRRKVQPSAE